MQLRRVTSLLLSIQRFRFLLIFRYDHLELVLHHSSVRKDYLE